MSTQLFLRDKENLISNGPLKQIQKPAEKTPATVQKSKSVLQERRALGDITNKARGPATAAPMKVKAVEKPIQVSKYNEPIEYAHIGKPVLFADPDVEAVDLKQLKKMPLTISKKRHSLIDLDDMPSIMDQEQLAIAEELPMDELHFNLVGYELSAPLELEFDLE